MNDLQKTQLEMLRQLDAVCRKLKIPYFLVCGSALGAVKYGGFIPWDDDLDVALYRDDYQKLLEAAPELLPEGLFLQNFRTDPQFPQIYSKLRRNGTTFEEPAVRHLAMHQGVFLDIFPLDGYPEGRLAQRKLEFTKRLLSSMLLSACDVPRSPRSALLCRLWRILGIHRRTASVAARLDKSLRKYPVKDSTETGRENWIMPPGTGSEPVHRDILRVCWCCCLKIILPIWNKNTAISTKRRSSRNKRAIGPAGWICTGGR